MGKYTVNHTCGHTVEVQLFGPIKERERKMEWMQSTICSDCYRKQEAEAAKAKAENSGLPELQGSEKQIAWALKLRQEQIKIAEDTLHGLRWYASGAYKLTEEEITANLRSKGVAEAEIKARLAAVASEKEKYERQLALIEQMKVETSAKWFIENR
ncbi:hypothetical protein [Anaerotalea alkaliphila]|uniref:Uncharacterized protein n=1 Tax=Anaerotalea alkaliphila TaxID=2662126 RepID=A0A7X5HWL4_9FIRM|nr:hypothetical protein [Anaerotalea alkaliphila]NDL68000.1 hypothetical protein [Anaerotalea alkaliphila]